MNISALSVFFQPRGVAVIGASREPGKLGHDAVRNLVEHGYQGPIYPVNPRADVVYGRRVYPTIADVPDPVDLAVIVVPARHVEAAVEACGERGLRAVIVVSGGFGEVGPDGAAAEARLAQTAQKYDMALLGPNCIGTIDTHTPLNTTFIAPYPQPGEIALLSQSGALVATILDRAERGGMGFSRIVSLGNEADVTESAMLEAVAADSHTRAISAYIEGVADGRTFLQTASRIAQEKAIVALKVGRGEAGAQAVSSHTGALAGTEAAYEAAFRRAGVLRADTLEAMLNWSRALAMQPLPRGNRVAVLTNAGGPGVLAVDALEAAGMQLAPLTEATRDFLRPRVPPASSLANPVDILAGSGPATYALCLDALLRDETVDAVVVITAPQDWFDPVTLAEIVADLQSKAKPVLTAIMGPTPDSPAADLLRRRRIPNFDLPEHPGSALGAMWRRRQWLDAGTDDSPTMPEPAPDRVRAREIAAQGEGWLPAETAESLLCAYGIPTAGGGLATTVDEALALAEETGYPVALKLAAADVTHKSDVGGVALDIESPEALREAFAALLERAGAYTTSIEGAYVQRMVRGGVELIAGVVRDPQFGPLAMLGSGGTQVELLGDVTFELAPVTRRQVAAMLERTTAGRLLAGYRGGPTADRDAVIDTLQRLAGLALDVPAIAEIEMNPLIALAEGVFAVDVRVRTTKEAD